MSLRGKAQKKSKKGPPMTWKTSPPKISGTAGRMTMKFLPDVKYHRETRNPKDFFDITHLVCNLWVSKVKKRSNSLFSGNATYRHASFTKFCRIINIDVKINPENFKSIS